MSRTVIAIDGPAGAGKSTVSHLVASKLGLGYVDTGATYRLVALRALERSVPLDDASAVANIATETMEACRLVDDAKLFCDGKPVGDEIRSPEVSQAASIVAAHADVRAILVSRQRSLVPAKGAVVEGRDIGTVVWPDADLKVYLDASSDVRESRRVAQQGDGAEAAVEVHERDTRDSTRAVSAMRPAPDSVIVDTSSMPAEQVADRIVGMLKPRRIHPLYVVIRGILSLLLRTAFRLEVEGAENIPKHGGAIIAPNHRSLIDHPAVGVLTKRQVWFMAKSELFKTKIGDTFLRAMGSFPVNRGKPDRGSLQRCLELLEQGELVGIYPEGTRSPESRFAVLEEGFAYIALKAGVPIVPVALSGTEAVLPHGRKFPRFVKIRIKVGEPFRLTEQRHVGVLPRAKIREATAVAQPRFAKLMNDLEPQ